MFDSTVGEVSFQDADELTEAAFVGLPKSDLGGVDFHQNDVVLVVVAEEDAPAFFPKIVDKPLGVVNSCTAGNGEPGVVAVAMEREVDLRVYHQVDSRHAVFRCYEPQRCIGAGLLKGHGAAGHFSEAVESHHLAEFEFSQQFSELFNITSNHKNLSPFFSFIVSSLGAESNPR